MVVGLIGTGVQGSGFLKTGIVVKITAEKIHESAFTKEPVIICIENFKFNLPFLNTTEEKCIMKRPILLCPFLILFFHAMGQATVTFLLNMDDLTEKALFSTASGDKVFVRGSFDDWQSNCFELKESPATYLFTGTFKLGKIGDIISYHYVIEREPNRTSF